ncbi:MAG: 50S ribosomal protein L29 [Verrucomicrobiota bacterium]|nr:50S ribosomal protein L29 [Verrucomicrobiota bacterium]
MKARNIREHGDQELEQLHDETLRKVFDLRVRKGVGNATDQPLLVRETRRDLARIKTVLRERELKKHG